MSLLDKLKTPPTAEPANPSRERDVAQISNYEELQPYQGVLTATNGALEISTVLQKEVAILGVGANNAFLVATTAYFGRAQHTTLLARARKLGVTIQQQLITTEDSVLTLIYEKDKRRLNSHQEDSALKADSIKLFELIVSEAVQERATDIHFIIREESSAVEFRIDGLLRHFKTYPSNLLNEAAGVAYNKMAEESSRSHPAYNVRAAQSCAVVVPSAAGRSLQLRYQSIPVVGGQNISMRLLFTDDEKTEVKSLQQLGYATSHQRTLTLAARKTVGSIFIAGVTGSGKSTTLKTLMLMSPDRHLWRQYSVEDPAEYKLPGVGQLSVQRTAEATSDSASTHAFVAAMRVIMRADPDEIMVGEVRDRESGSLLKTMVQSGHQVYTTVHAASAVEIVERLTSPEIGLSRQTLSSRNFISAFVYQRLLALNCSHCGLPADGNLDEEYLALIERKFGIGRASMRVASKDGCPHCKGRGVIGLTVVAEIIVPDNTLLKLIREGRDMEAEELWRSRRTARFDEEDAEGKTAFEHALYKMSRGLLDPRVIEDSFEPFETYQLLELPAGTA